MLWKSFWPYLKDIFSNVNFLKLLPFSVRFWSGWSWCWFMLLLLLVGAVLWFSTQLCSNNLHHAKWCKVGCKSIFGKVGVRKYTVFLFVFYDCLVAKIDCLIMNCKIGIWYLIDKLFKENNRKWWIRILVDDTEDKQGYL